MLKTLKRLFSRCPAEKPSLLASTPESKAVEPKVDPITYPYFCKPLCTIDFRGPFLHDVYADAAREECERVLDNKSVARKILNACPCGDLPPMMPIDGDLAFTVCEIGGAIEPLAVTDGVVTPPSVEFKEEVQTATALLMQDSSVWSTDAGRGVAATLKSREEAHVIGAMVDVLAEYPHRTLNTPKMPQRHDLNAGFAEIEAAGYVVTHVICNGMGLGALRIITPHDFEPSDASDVEHDGVNGYLWGAEVCAVFNALRDYQYLLVAAPYAGRIKATRSKAGGRHDPNYTIAVLAHEVSFAIINPKACCVVQKALAVQPSTEATEPCTSA